MPCHIFGGIEYHFSITRDEAERLVERVGLGDWVWDNEATLTAEDVIPKLEAKLDEERAVAEANALLDDINESKEATDQLDALHIAQLAEHTKGGRS